MEKPPPQPSIRSALTARTRVILHHPFFPENVGAAARAMHNCGIGDLRLLGGALRTDQPGAIKLAVGAETLLASARHHAEDDWAAAIADCNLVFGTTSRRSPQHREVTPRKAAEMAAQCQGAVALVFGNEKNGLSVADLRHVHAVIRIPTVSTEHSLNLAQAVMVLCYEWCLADQTPTLESTASWRDLASEPQMAGLLADMDRLLHKRSFYKPHNADQRASVLRRIAARLALDAEEAATLRGLLGKLAGAPQSQGPV